MIVFVGTGRERRIRKGFRWLTLAIVVLGTGWGVFQAFGFWRDSAALSAARQDIAARRFDLAQKRLSVLASRRPSWDEAAYALGVCEASLGRVDEALRSFGRVSAESRLAPVATLDRARLALEHGRLSLAEDELGRIVDRKDEIGDQAERLMEQVLLFSGRSGEIGPLFERRWRSGHDPVGTLRAHWLLDAEPLPVSAISERLNQFEQEAPDDDRIWLGRANLALHAGQLDEADRWLDRCEARRPNDLAVARSRLSWAIASRSLDQAHEAAARIRVDQLEPSESARLLAQLANFRGDRVGERQALERLVELEPGDAAAWSRLADLAAKDGETQRRAQYRERKAEIDRWNDDYRRLMGAAAQGDRSRTVELAQIAESLGRRFEARGWWTLSARSSTDNQIAQAGLRRLRESQSKNQSSKPTGPRSGQLHGGNGPAEPPAAASRTLADLVWLSRPGNTKTSDSTLTSAQSSQASAGNLILRMPRFRDDAEKAGLRFRYEHDPSPLHRLPETMGGGLGLLDYDGDGFLDVYCVQGGRFPEGKINENGGGDRLFHNRGDGTFDDVTERAGLQSASQHYGHGVSVGDIDNDGHPDLFVTRWRSYSLYRNKGDGTFEDATEQMGLGGDRGWPTSSAFADLDNDGDLDLYVCQYLRWDPSSSQPCPDPDRAGQYLYCVPRGFEAEPDRLFRNDGGLFVDVTDEAGIVDLEGRGLGVVAADIDDDGLVDLFVANDMTGDLLFHNLGGLRFEEIGQASGVASNSDGGFQAGMGVASGDLDSDGRPELVVTNFHGESTSLFHNLGGALFVDGAASAGLSAPTRFVLGFGT
jgi:tetratricopeptide (TPR) repeat protein